MNKKKRNEPIATTEKAKQQLPPGEKKKDATVTSTIEEPILLQKIPSTNKNQFESNKKYFTICIYALFVITIGAFIIYNVMNFEKTRSTVSEFFGVLSPFLSAFFIAYLLNPFVKKIDAVLLQKLLKVKSDRLRKVLSIFFAYICVLGIIVIAIFYITPQIAKSINAIKELTENTDKLTNIYLRISNYLTDLANTFPELNLDFSVIQEKINEGIPALLSYGTNLATNLIPMLFNTSIFIVKGFINILLSIVISLYMLSDKSKLAFSAKKIIYAFLPERKAINFCNTASECNKIFTGFIIGKFIDSVIIGIICFFLMMLLRLPYTVLISVIVGVTNMIPYFGPFIGAVPGVLLYLFVNPIQAVIFAIMILGLQQFDGLILGPKILGDSTGLTPLWVIFGITLGGAYGGVLGMFLGVPTVAVIAYLFNKLIKNKLSAKKITHIDHLPIEETNPK